MATNTSTIPLEVLTVSVSLYSVRVERSVTDVLPYITIECMRFFGSVLDPTSSVGKYRDRPFSVFFLHVLKDVLCAEDVAIFQLYMTVHDSIQFAKVARKMCLRKRGRVCPDIQ